MTTPLQDLQKNLNAQFIGLWEAMGLKGDAEVLAQELIAAWSEPGRHYHNLYHLSACLDHAWSVRNELDDPLLVHLALWFHDAIYAPTAKDNEKQSAIWAEKATTNSGLSVQRRRDLYDLIMVTDHKTSSKNKDEAFMLDIDLAVLGAPIDVFVKYDQAIRKEYEMVPWEIYRPARLEILKSFASRRYLYQTKYFQDTLGQQATANLNFMMDKLKSKQSEGLMSN